MEKRILVTGYEPFGGQRINPSWICVDMLPDTLEGVTVIKREIPVEWDTALDHLLGYLEEYRPQAVLCVGQAGGSAKLAIERVGINLCDGADNRSVTKRDAPVFHGGPAAYFTTLPYADMLAALEEGKVPAEYSFSAGTYLCNSILYTGLHYGANRFSGLKAGFLHVPHLPQQVEYGPTMPLETMSKGVQLCVEAICRSLAE